MRTLIILHSLVLASLVTSLSGQTAKSAPAYIRPPVPKELGEFSISLRYTQAPAVKFGNLGNIALKDPIMNDDVEGYGRVAVFNDGFVIAGYAGNSRDVNTGDTTAYYTSLGDSNTTGVSNVSADQTQLLLHQYGTRGGANVFYDGDVSDNMGWEIGYTRFFSEKRVFGIEFGFSFDGFDVNYQNQLSRELYYKEWAYAMDGGATVPSDFSEVMDSDGNFSYYQDAAADLSPDSTTANNVARSKINLVGTAPTEHTGATAVEVNSAVAFRSAMYNFRLGPTYRYKLGERFSLNIGAGIMARYIDAEFTSTEYLVISDLSGTYTTGLIKLIDINIEKFNGGEKLVNSSVENQKTTTNESAWQIGAYVDGSMSYLVTDRISLMAGFQYQQGSTYSQETNGATVDMDLDGMLSIKTGFGVKF